MRKKKNLEPRMEQCEACWIKKPESLRGAWNSLMPERKALHLELGCGKGRFTCEMAEQNKEVLFVAVERVPDAMVIAMERAQAMGLSNVFFVDGDAEKLSEYFAPDEIDRIYINFCDPWPGHRHARRRLTHENMLKRYRSVLQIGGQIHFKTDNKDLYEFSLFQFPKAGYELSEVTRNLHEDGVQGVMTDYEEKFHLQGMPIHRCVGTKLEQIPQISEQIEPDETTEED
jgi:tRNA (guanine-N7-)-methyltransferase